jgi:hypothetical protein
MKWGDVMQSEVFVALLSFLGTLAGTVGGIITSAKLTNYRLRELEKKVDKHNNFAQRIPLLEERVKTHEQRITTIERNEYYE